MLPVPTREVKCARCGAINRIGAYELNKIPRCGKCREALTEPFSKPFLRWLFRHRYLIGLGLLNGGLLIWLVLKDQTVSNQQSTRNEAITLCPAYPQPFTGVYTVDDLSDRVAPLTIKTRPGGGYFVKLQKASTGRSVMSFYIHGGQTLQEMVPEGSFTLKYAAGNRWCGDDDLFGPDTTIQRADRIFDFDESHSYTVELIKQPGGNLKTLTINRKEF